MIPNRMINYNNKRFRVTFNVDSGESSTDTLFHYWQEGNIIWATYKGGHVTFGTITGVVDRNGHLDFSYQHVNKEAKIMTGKCQSTPEILADGKIRLHEKWQWTSGKKEKGISIAEEI